MELLLVSMASLLAGFVDAIVGGGGLILVPALFAIFPGTHPATLFGVNKSASIWGTAMAALQYSRKVQLSWPALLPAATAGFAGSFAGAWAVTVVSPEFLRALLDEHDSGRRDNSHWLWSLLVLSLWFQEMELPVAETVA